MVKWVLLLVVVLVVPLCCVVRVRLLAVGAYVVSVIKPACTTVSVGPQLLVQQVKVLQKVQDQLV